MINKILDGLFFVNSLLVGIMIGYEVLGIFGFVEFDKSLFYPVLVIMFLYFIEGIFVVRRTKLQ